jgi:hypothetical protein
VVIALLSFSFSVLVWQDWSYQGYWQLLGIFAVFLLTIALVGMNTLHESRPDGRG